jgi:hypothetical protein
LDDGMMRVTEWLMQFQDSPKEKPPVENIFWKECKGFSLSCLHDPF